MFVYKITNKINGKMYIGQHSGNDLIAYWKTNLSFVKHGYKQKPLLYNAIRKYGSENFEIKPLVIVSSKYEMDLYEKGLIKTFNTKSPKGYNLTDGGEGRSGTSTFVKDETRKKMSKAALGNKRMFGKKMPLSSVITLIQRNLGNSYNKGKKFSKESTMRLSKAMLGNVNSRAVNHNRWHIKRNIINPECKLCQGIQCPEPTTMTAVSPQAKE